MIVSKEYQYDLSGELEEEIKRYIITNGLNLSIEEIVKIAVTDFIKFQNQE